MLLRHYKCVLLRRICLLLSIILAQSEVQSFCHCTQLQLVQALLEAVLAVPAYSCTVAVAIVPW